MQEIHGEYFQNALGLNLMDYVHPNEILHDDRLSLTERRALLCAWASDACAVDSRPGFRWLPGTPGPILVDHIFTALRSLDDLATSSQHTDYAGMTNGQPFFRDGRPYGAAGTISK
jgi:hypothetical protein